jgi:hypothetical protein
MEKYRQFTVDVFNYLNPRITPRNPCVLTISVYNPYNYGEFKKPNYIDIPLGSIINNFYGRDDMIKSVIVLSICHELQHADQMTDMIRYTYDKDYAEALEAQAEYKAERFMFDHARELHDRFGVNPSKTFIAPTKAPTSPYQAFDCESYYINTLADVVYRSADSLAELKEIFNRKEDIYATFYIAFCENGECSDAIMIRDNWVYLLESINDFNEEIAKVRNGTTKTSFNTHTTIFEWEGSVVMVISIDNKTCYPIAFF